MTATKAKYDISTKILFNNKIKHGMYHGFLYHSGLCIARSVLSSAITVYGYISQNMHFRHMYIYIK